MKNFKSLALTALFILGLFTKMFAQIGIPNDPELAIESMKRTLIIVKDEISERKIKKYKKKGTYEAAQKLYDQRNETVLKHFKEHWKLNENVISKTESELKVLKKAKSTEYAYIQLKEMMDTKKKKDMVTGFEKTYRYYYWFFTMRLTDKGKTLGTITTRGSVLNDMEYLFAINTLQYFIQFVSDGKKRKNLEEDINLNAPILKEKTLLLPNYLTKIDVDELKKLYPYKVEIVSESEVIEKVIAKDSNYAYAYVNHKFGSCGTRYNHFIVDCGENKPLLLDKRNKISLGQSSQMSVFDDIATINSLLKKDGSLPSAFKQKFIKKKQIEKYVEIIEGK